MRKFRGRRTRHVTLIPVREGNWVAVIGGVVLPTLYLTARYSFEQAKGEISRVNPNTALRVVDGSGSCAGAATRCPRCRFPLSPAKYCRHCKHGWEFKSGENDPSNEQSSHKRFNPQSSVKAIP